MDDELSKEAKQHAEILKTFNLSRDPVLTAREIGDEIDISTEQAHQRLKRMEANGMVQNKRAVWWTVPAPYIDSEALNIIQPRDCDSPITIDQIRDEICDD